MKLILRIFVVFITVMSSIAFSAEPERILCFGNSITDKGTWVKTVGEEPAFETVNAGLSGRKVAEGEEALKNILPQYSELDRIIIFLGVNDLPARDERPGVVKVAKCVTDMNKIINVALKEFDPEDIILVAPCGVNPNDMSKINLRKGYDVVQPLLEKMEKEYKMLAKQKGIKFFSLLDVVSKGNYKDGLHPNKEGDDEIAEAVMNYLKKN